MRKHPQADTLELMRTHLPRDARVHVHCFTSSKAMALALFEHFPNLRVGFTGVVTFKSAKDVRDVVSATPLERILLGAFYELSNLYSPIPRHRLGVNT